MYLPQLARTMTTNPTPSAKALEALEAFSRMVAYKPAEARSFVRDAVAELDDSFPRSEILAVMLEHPDGNVRLAAIEALRAA